MTAAIAGCQPGDGRAEGKPYHRSDWHPQDWTVLQNKVRWGVERGLDTMPVGRAIVRLAETFVGEPYTPHTLEVEGPERVVINLREFDCVTLIETVLALVQFIRRDGTELLADRARAEAQFERYLRGWRYRGGMLDGYASRLHYFSEWLSDNERRGRLLIITRELGGVPDSRPIHFMTSNHGAYRQLAEPGVVEAIRAIEQGLVGERWMIPQAGIATAARGIQDGDIIAATSTLDGLDVAHTGFAIWRDGQLHLLHAPLVGTVVEISERTLAERIGRIATQNGIIVGRVATP